MNRSANFLFLLGLLIAFSSHSQSARRGSRGAEASSNKSSSTGSGGGSRGYLWEAVLYYGGGSSKADPAKVNGQPLISNEFESNSGFYSLRFGRVYGPGIYLGALYANRSDVRGLVTTPGRSQALGLGYFGDSGARFRFYYHLGETYGDFSDGKGGSAELGYYLKLGSQVYLGFLATYQQIQYFKNPMIPNFKDWTASWSHPALILAYSTR